MKDTAFLGVAYTLSLLSTWLCHRARPMFVLRNLIVMVIYNVILAYNLFFNSQCGSGMTWWLFSLLLNTVHSIALLVFVIAYTIKREKSKNGH